jgi:amino acid transporter
MLRRSSQVEGDLATTESRAKVEVAHVRRTLGLGALVFIMFFTVSGGAYGLEDTIGESGAGMGLLLILITPLIWAIPAALVVAELATAMPVEGGYYYWVKNALGPFWGFCEGWWSWITSWVDMAIYPVLFVEYAAYFFPDLFGDEGSAFYRWLLGAAVIWTFTYLNIRGAKVVGDSSTVFGVIVLAPFVLLTIFAIFNWQYDPFEPFVNPGQDITSAFALGLFVVMWNYLGWDGVSTVAGEMKAPQRDYPRMLLITVPLITAVYFFPTLAGLGAAGSTEIEWTAGAFTLVAEAVAGPWLGQFLAVAALVAAAGLFSSLLLTISRVPFVMSEDGYLPKALLKVHPRYGTPWVSLIVSSAIYTVFILGPFQSLVVVDVTIYAGALLLEFAAFIALRIKRPNMERPYRVPGGWFGAILVVLFPTAVILIAVYFQAYFEGWQGSIGLAILGLATGPILYPFARRYRQKRGVEDQDLPSGSETA